MEYGMPSKVLVSRKRLARETQKGFHVLYCHSCMENKFAVSVELSICWQQTYMAIVVGFKEKIMYKTPTFVQPNSLGLHVGNFEFSKWNKCGLNLLCLVALDKLCQNSPAYLELNSAHFGRKHLQILPCCRSV